VEKGRWRRVGGEASSYSPVLHCCYLAVTADWFLAKRIDDLGNKNQQNAQYLL
jgi:hypothetical protein